MLPACLTRPVYFVVPETYRPTKPISTALPALTVTSSNVLASNASLYVSNILGDGATFSAITDRVGTITTINIIDPGEDYVSTPNVSMKVQDIIVSNVSINNIVKTGDIVYQGTSYANSSYIAIVSSLLKKYLKSQLSLLI